MTIKPSFQTLIDMVEKSAIERSSNLLFRQLDYAEQQQDLQPSRIREITYTEFSQRVKSLSSLIQTQAKPGDRALLILEPGINFIVSFFASLFAGVVAIPVCPPSNKDEFNKLSKILADSRPSLFLLSKMIHQHFEQNGINKYFAKLNNVVSQQQHDTPVQHVLHSCLECYEGFNLLVVDAVDVNGLETFWKEPDISSESTAFLQYSSGSTSDPKAVVLTHGNLLNNLFTMYKAMDYTPKRHTVTWLPHYHDMGLICGLMEPLYSNSSATILSPLSFIEYPLRWLWAISEYRGSLVGSPNFGYDLCVKSFMLKEKENRELFKNVVDLSCLEVVASGAEPIRAETMEKFSSLFSEFGLRRESMYPCYGLAESTLYVSGVVYRKGFDVVTVRRDDQCSSSNMKNGQIENKTTHQQFVNCGINHDDGQVIKIVNPDTCCEVEQGKVGEVWLSSPSVAKGYWEKPQLTQETFHARVNGDTEREYLRTGDLGFVIDGNLYITGRLKDVIILNGVNYYPQDVEVVCAQCDPNIRTGCVVACTKISDEGNEELIVIAETKATTKEVLEANVQSIRLAIAEQIGISMYNALSTVVLMSKRSVLKTTSGKLRRQPTKHAFLNNKLPKNQILFRWDKDKSELDILQQHPSTPLEIELAKIWKDLIGSSPLLFQNFFLLGGNSMNLIQLKSRIQQKFKVNVSLSDMVNSPTLHLMAKLVDKASSQQIEHTSLKSERSGSDASPLELSNSQKRFWFLHHLIDNPAIHNVFAGIRLKGKLDKEALGKSLAKIIEHHESLRTCFIEHGLVALQQICSSINFELKNVSLAHPEDLNKLLFEMVNTPFNLNEAPLVRANLFELSEHEHVLALVFHHIIIDGWSMNLLVEELVQYYHMFQNQSSIPPLSNVLQYSDYTLWQQATLNQHNEKQLQYWEQKLSNLPDKINLPTHNPVSKCYKGSHHWFSISPEHANSLRKLINPKGATLYMGLLTLFNILLYRYSEQTDIIVGTPVVNRQQHVELESLIGLLVNTLAIRTNLKATNNFYETLTETKSTVIDAFDNQDVPFQEIVDRLKMARESFENPLFQVMLAMHNPQRRISMDDLDTEIVKLDNGSSMFHLTLEVQEVEDGSLQCSFEYRLDLFKKEIIERMAENFIELLKCAIKEPEKPINKLSFIGNSELVMLNKFGNHDRTLSPSRRTLHELVEEQVMKTPNNVAVMFKGQTLTYQQLEQKSNHLANQLRFINTSKNPFIAISVDRSLELIVCLLAILKVGHAYLPLDPIYPEERLNYMLQDSQAGLLLTQSTHIEKFKSYQGKVLNIDLFDWTMSSTSTSTNNDEQPVHVSSNDLAYQLYTSGSTGNAKGCMITHGNVVNTLCGLINLYEMSQSDKFIHYSSYSFDVSLEEIFLPLITGASIVVAHPNIQYQLDELIELVESSKATILGVTPSLWHGIRYHVSRNLKSTSSLRIVTIGNEPVDLNSVQEIQRMCPNATVLNVCGGTETCIDWSLFKIPNNFAESPVPIGKPIPGVKLYVLDSNGQHVPIGVQGELHVGGNGVGRGYWQNDELTTKSFIKNQFQSEEEKKHGINSTLFKTGDLVRWLPDGNMVFISRLDNQVKLRGFRVEIGEIENVMRRSSGQVRDAIVLLQHVERRNLQSDDDDDNGDDNLSKQLVGYIVRHDDDDDTRVDDSVIVEQTRSYLMKHLPYYMVPTHIICLGKDQVPTTSNGKLDRKALPRISINQIPPTTKDALVVPQSDSESKLREIWSKVLKKNLQSIGVEDNFFEVGGNSILVAQLRSMVRIECGVQIALKMFFEKLTIRSLASEIDFAKIE